MNSIRWTFAAQRDYRNIIEWIAERNAAAATRIADQINQRITSLMARPRIGRPGRVDGTRELVIARTRYIVIYQIEAIQEPEEAENEVVVILRVLHSAQRWPPMSR